ncbi:MAG: hypothetical protein WCC79_04000, partial [Nitrososphaeraceae archaeon]
SHSRRHNREFWQNPYTYMEHYIISGLKLNMTKLVVRRLYFITFTFTKRNMPGQCMNGLNHYDGIIATSITTINRLHFTPN